jgi:quercetin dioxygenase-like cupin family protein
MEISMLQRSRLIVSALIAASALGLIASPLVGAEQQAIKRQDLLTLELHDIQGSDMHVWVAEVAPGAATGRHSHPTPRFVYVIEGAVVLELDDKSAQAFKAGQAFAEMPNEIHNFRNASTTEPAKALGFQYARTGQALQSNAP